MRANRSRLSFTHLSIQQRLPLLICGFLLFAIVIYGFANYFSLKKATLTIGKERVNSLTNQISAMLGQSAQTLIKVERSAAARKSVIACLKSGGKNFRAEVNSELNRLHKDSTYVSTELLDINQTTLLRSDQSTVNVPVNLKKVLLSVLLTPDSAKVGNFYYIKNATYYPIIAAVSENKLVLGYIVCWKWLPASKKSVEELNQLMGVGTNLYLGNTDGSFWTNTFQPISGLSVNAKQLKEPIEYTDEYGKHLISKAQAIPYTDWFAIIQFSEQNVMEGVNSFMKWIFLFGVVLMSVGTFAAWVMSRNITRPLKVLTDAAKLISNGDYPSPMSISAYRNDELGELAAAFNIMAFNVRQTQHELAQKVEERTVELTEEVKLRKASEEFLRLSRQRYLMLVNEVKDYAIIMLDAEGRVLLWNKGAEKIKGYDEEEILGKPSSCFYTEEDIKNNKPQMLLKKAVKEGRAEDEGWRVRKDGSKFWADVVFTSIHTEDGKLIGFAKVTRDITEQKKQEEERRVISEKLEDRVKEVAMRTLQLELANKELEAFSYSVSHDLRTPLRAISGYSIMLKEDYDAKLDSEGNRIIRNIITNAKMMGQLIDDLLAFSRLGKKEQASTQVDIQLIATNVVNELLQNEAEKHFVIKIDQLPTVKADQAMIKQVLINLVGNAIKYSSKKAEPMIEIGSIDEEAKITYYVRDNGVGFDMAYVGKLFGVFQRLHSQEEFEGTGVGLALVKRIIDKHKGEIWAEGEENIGATFYFSLPKD